jgi:hypothetical protein
MLPQKGLQIFDSYVLIMLKNDDVEACWVLGIWLFHVSFGLAGLVCWSMPLDFLG